MWMPTRGIKKLNVATPLLSFVAAKQHHSYSWREKRKVIVGRKSSNPYKKVNVNVDSLNKIEGGQ